MDHVLAYIRQRFHENAVKYNVPLRRDWPIKIFEKGKVLASVFFKPTFGVSEFQHMNVSATVLKAGITPMLTEIVDHEFAHVWTHDLHGPRVAAHGEQWKHCMRMMGYSKPSARVLSTELAKHGIETTKARRTRYFQYVCPCGTHFDLTSARHTKVQSGRASFSCRKCKGKLLFNGKEHLK